MTNAQFNFSLTVGVALAVIGAVILGKAAVGFSLVALGAGIATLAVFTRIANGRASTARAAAPLGRSNATGRGYRSPQAMAE